MPSKNASEPKPKPMRLLQGLMPVFGPAFLFTCLINILVSTSPIFMMQVMDRVLPSSNLSTLTMLTLIAAFALAVMSVLEMMRSVMLARAANWWEAEWSKKLLPHAARGESEAAETAGNLSKVAGFIGGPSVSTLFDAPWAILFFGLIYMLHPMLAALGGVVALLLVAIALLGHLTGKQRQQEAVAARTQAGGLAAQLDRNAPLLATMGMASNMLGLHRNLQATSHDRYLGVLEPEQMRKMVAKYARTLLQILTLAVGAYLVLQGELTGGGMIASSLILARALGPVEQITGVWSNLLEARIALEDLEVVARGAEAEPERTELPEPSGFVTCEGVTIPTAPGQPPILQQVSFRIEPGECVAVMGSSGSGKSTLASLIAGATSPVIGSVRIDQFDIRHWPDQQRAQIIGFLPQVPTLFPGTIAQNIGRFDPSADPKEIVRAATEAGVHSLISKLPEGYETEVGFESGPLSGGERQRVALARAIFRDPKVLVLDEPNASLDKEGERALMTSMARLKEAGACILLVAHRAGVLAMADTILLLDGGRIRDYGPKHEVVGRMNARSMQIELARTVADIPRLEDWVHSHFKRGGDAEAKANATQVAVEMFNLSLKSPSVKDDKKPILFTFKHRRGMCTVTMYDNCELIAAQTIKTAKLLATSGGPASGARDHEEAALATVLGLAHDFGQKALDGGAGRMLMAEIPTPVHEHEEDRGPAPTEVH